LVIIDTGKGLPLEISEGFFKGLVASQCGVQGKFGFGKRKAALYRIRCFTLLSK